MRFLLEADLEKLAKWLRFLGQNVKVLPGPINKEDVVRERERVFITTSKKWEKHLKAWGVDYLLIPKDDWKVQLCIIIKHFGIKPKLVLNQCVYCNAELKPVEKEEIKDKLPPPVYEFAKDFTLCLTCGRIYWKGTHFPRMKARLKEVLKNC